MAELSNTQKSAIQRVISAVLVDTRPNEAFLVNSLYSKAVTVAKRTEALGFGTGVEVVLWMYPLLEVFKELAGTAAKEFAKKWGDHLAAWLFDKGTPVASLKAEALLTLRNMVVERLLSTGATAREANSAGDALVRLLLQEPALLRETVSAK
jgi:hypothetical protein